MIPKVTVFPCFSGTNSFILSSVWSLPIFKWCNQPLLPGVNFLLPYPISSATRGLPVELLRLLAGNKSFHPSQMEASLAAAGIPIEIFDTTVSASDGIANLKPSPQIFLKAAEKLQIDPVNCIVIEDSRAGIQAAESAGVCYSVSANCLYTDHPCIALSSKFPNIFQGRFKQNRGINSRCKLYTIPGWVLNAEPNFVHPGMACVAVATTLTVKVLADLPADAVFPDIASIAVEDLSATHEKSSEDNTSETVSMTVKQLLHMHWAANNSLKGFISFHEIIYMYWTWLVHTGWMPSSAWIYVVSVSLPLLINPFMAQFIGYFR